MSDTPVIYLAVIGTWGGDISVGAYDPQYGDQISSHVCSNESFMRHDLIDRKQGVRDELARRYPDGYDIVTIPIGEELPAPTYSHKPEGKEGQAQS